MTASLQYYIGPSLPPSCWNRWRRWARSWLMPSLSARAGAAFLCSRAGCVRCFTSGNTIASLCSWAAAGFSSLPSLDLLTARRSMLARCEAWGATAAGSFPISPGGTSAGPCLATGLQGLEKRLVGRVCAICNPCGFNVTGNVVI